jgi:hypothetical protein
MEESQISNLNVFLNCLPEEFGVLFFKLLAAKRPDEFMDAAEQFDAYERISDKVIEMFKS